jgi:NAD(P)-dependent dehydrogenase (short-subunit alcohol dehydrogenase family)
MPTALIVGASRGIGRALAEEHLRRGWQVVATVRRPDALADLEASSGAALTVEIVDMIDWPGVDALHKRLHGRSLDLLLVNAGIAGKQETRLSRITPEGFTEVMLVNALGPLRIADGFLDLVASAGTVAVVSSGLGSIADNASGGYEPYRMSKAALDMGLRSIAARDGARRRTFLAICPGWVSSDMGGRNAPLTPRQSAKGIADTLAARRGAGGVAFVDHGNRTLAW